MVIRFTTKKCAGSGTNGMLYVLLLDHGLGFSFVFSIVEPDYKLERELIPLAVSPILVFGFRCWLPIMYCTVSFSSLPVGAPISDMGGIEKLD